MEINIEVPDEGPIRTRRRGSGVAYFLGRIFEKVADLILEACFFFIGCLILGAWEFGELIGRVREFIRRAWGKDGPLIFVVAVKWEWAFVLSCIAVSLDPLFLYIPIVDETNKCLAMDKNLKPIALILRSLTDFLLITHIIAQICNGVRTDYPKYSSSAVGILVGFFRMRGSDFLVNRKFLNISLVLQYLPRVCQIYLIKSEFRMAGKWVNPSFNLFLYILASHILGALWYFFAIERETSCWYKACRKTQGCVVSSYNCGGGGSGSGNAKNITLLDQLCPINSPNSTVFDFGIFVKILQSGNTGSDKFVTKLFYSLWWGLKNLSNFGTNLETSNYLWENCFAILICVIGLLLFLYLIGNVQLYIQWSTQKSLNEETSRTQSIKKNKTNITNWMKDKNLNDKERKKIKRYIIEDKVVEKNLSHGVDVDVAYFLNTSVTVRIKKRILKYLGVAALKKILLGDIMDDEDDAKLKKLCQLMEPEVYTRGEEVVTPGGRLDKMLFIIEGQLKCTDQEDPLPFFYDEGEPPTLTVGKNEYYGQDILEWALLNYTTRSYYDDVPLSTKNVEAGKGKVEALGLDAWKLLRFIEKNVNINSPKLKELALPPREADQMSTEVQVSRDPTVLWKSPDGGSLKLNCTSLWDPNSKTARLGAILGNHEGALIEAGICYSQPCIDEFEAAAYSIKSYIKFHSRYVSIKIVVESDNEFLINCLNNWPSLSKERFRRSLLLILENIISVASKFKSCTFVHCERQTNAAAILLAKHAAPAPDSSKTWTAHENIIEWLATFLTEDSPPLKVPTQEPDPKAQKQQPVAKAQKQEPVPKEQNISKVQNQKLVAEDSEAASDELKTAK